MSKLLDYILCLGVCCALMHPYRANANKLKYKAFKSQQRFFRETRCSTCKALFSELLLEVQRHSLHADGEEDILDSVEAACLGVVQNYTIIESPPWVVFQAFSTAKCVVSSWRRSDSSKLCCPLPSIASFSLCMAALEGPATSASVSFGTAPPRTSGESSEECLDDSTRLCKRPAVAVGLLFRLPSLV